MGLRKNPWFNVLQKNISFPYSEIFCMASLKKHPVLSVSHVSKKNSLLQPVISGGPKHRTIAQPKGNKSCCPMFRSISIHPPSFPWLYPPAPPRAPDAPTGRRWRRPGSRSGRSRGPPSWRPTDRCAVPPPPLPLLFSPCLPPLSSPSPPCPARD